MKNPVLILSLLALLGLACGEEEHARKKTHASSESQLRLTSGPSDSSESTGADDIGEEGSTQGIQCENRLGMRFLGFDSQKRSYTIKAVARVRAPTNKPLSKCDEAKSEAENQMNQHKQTYGARFTRACTTSQPDNPDVGAVEFETTVKECVNIFDQDTVEILTEYVCCEIPASGGGDDQSTPEQSTGP